MLNAIEAKNRALEKGLGEAYFLRKRCEEAILNASLNHMQWCLVPTKDFTTKAKLSVYRELIDIYGYSVSQRNDTEGNNCLYIKWGHAHDSTSKNKQCNRKS